jgi:hypothetical protein
MGGAIPPLPLAPVWRVQDSFGFLFFALCILKLLSAMNRTVENQQA